MTKKKFIKESWVLLARHIVGSVLFGILFLFLATNILFAVSLPDIDPLIRGKNDAVLAFIKNSRKLTDFKELFPEIQSMFMIHENDLYKDDKDRQIMIVKLEKALTINPKSRDVLYSLYLLYFKSDNSGKAAYYLKRAQEVDPSLQP